MQREGIFREMKRRRAYEKPSERRMREKAEAVRRIRKLERKQAQREGLIASRSPNLPGLLARLGDSGLTSAGCHWRILVVRAGAEPENDQTRRKCLSPKIRT
jgi:small subunit ribosomal protein S21